MNVLKILNYLNNDLQYRSYKNLFSILIINMTLRWNRYKGNKISIYSKCAIF